jgi:hypothetical protein
MFASTGFARTSQYQVPQAPQQVLISEKRD